MEGDVRIDAGTQSPRERRQGVLRGPIVAAIATLALIALGLAAGAAPANASDGTFDRMWGWGVDDGGAEFQICTGGCQAGSLGSGDGQFDFPVGVATDAAGDVYVADPDDHRIQKFDSDGTFITKWGSLGTGDGQFNRPYGVATDAAGDVYVADFYNHRIQKFDSDGTFITKWGTEGSGDGQLYQPVGVATDAAGDVYVAEFFNNRIQKFDSDGSLITKWGTFGSGDGQFSHPVGVATDPAGDVYVTDSENSRIQKFDSDGTFITKWGTFGSGDGQFVTPHGIVTDAAGDVYVADYASNRIQKFDSDGSFITKWGTTGSGDGQFNGSVGVATDPAGDVYVTDSENSRIQKFGTATNQAPAADAGADYETVSGAISFLDGSGSSDPDDDLLDYSWTQTSGPAVTINGASNALASFVAPAGPATLEFELEVCDGEPLCDTDTVAVTVEAAPPPEAPTITATTPASPANDNAPKIQGTLGAGSPTEVRIYASADCSGPVAASGSAAEFTGAGITVTVADNTTTPLSAIAVGGSDSSCSNTISYTEDSAAPNTLIDSGPRGPTNNPSPSFAFHSPEPSVSFECRLDPAAGGTWAPCTSPKDYTNLAEGPHRFEVRAIDAAGNADPSPRVRTIRVDTIPPNTLIDSGPRGLTDNPSPSFTFHSPQPGVSFECRLDPAAGGTWAPCSSPKDYTDLARGPHRFEVRAIDAAGNADPSPAVRTINVQP